MLLPLLALSPNTHGLSLRDLQLIEQLEDHDDERRRGDKSSTRWVEEEEDEPEDMLDAYIAMVYEVDHEIRSRMMFRPLKDQERAIQKERERRVLEGPSAFSEIDDEVEFNRLLGELYEKKRRRVLKQRGARVSSRLQKLQPEMKGLILTQTKNILEACGVIVNFCAASRGMCIDDVWEYISNVLLRIPVAKPPNTTWNAWINRWCRKLSAYSPWSSTLVDPMKDPQYVLHGEVVTSIPPEVDVFDFTVEECTWRLEQRLPSTYTSIEFAGGVSIPPYLFNHNKDDEGLAPFWPANRKWLNAALRHDGRLLEYAADSIRDDDEMVRLACASNTVSFSFASDRLRRSGEFIRSFMFSQPNILSVYEPICDDAQIQAIREQIYSTRESLSFLDEWNEDDHAGDVDAANGYEVKNLAPYGVGDDIFVRVGFENTYRSLVPSHIMLSFVVYSTGQVVPTTQLPYEF